MKQVKSVRVIPPRKSSGTWLDKVGHLTLIALAVLIVTVLIFRPNGIPPTPSPPSTFPTEVHEPIVVVQDGDFTAPDSGFGCECVRGGSGNPEDPYIIAGWEINASGGVGLLIAQTSSSFTVVSLIVHADKSYAGIFLNTVVDGRIQNATVTGAFTGIRVLASTNVEISRSIVEDNENGIHLEASDTSTVNENSVSRNGQIGIFIRGSGNRIIGNNVTDSAYGGINIDGTIGRAEYNVVEGNAVKRNRGYGIGLWNAEYNTIRGNRVEENEGKGIALTDSNNNTIQSNTAAMNEGDGILLTGTTSNNLVDGNELQGNGDGVAAYDLHEDSRGSGNIWSNNRATTRQPANLQ